MDPLELHRRAGAEFASVLEHVSDDDLTAATRCDDWTVADLIEHVVDGNMSAAERVGVEPTPLPDVDRATRYRASAEHAHAAFSAPVALERTVELPFGTLPAAVLIAIRSGDQYAHAWDLAPAIGADTSLDDEVGQAVHAATAPILSPSLRGDDGPFAEEQSCPGDASVAHRYAAFLGRVVQ